MNHPTEQGAVRRRYTVARADLPLSCPLPNARLWDAHPRVYLSIEETGRVVCPYCNAEFVLSDGSNVV